MNLSTFRHSKQATQARTRTDDWRLGEHTRHDEFTLYGHRRTRSTSKWMWFVRQRDTRTHHDELSHAFRCCAYFTIVPLAGRHAEPAAPVHLTMAALLVDACVRVARRSHRFRFISITYLPFGHFFSLALFWEPNARCVRWHMNSHSQSRNLIISRPYKL